MIRFTIDGPEDGPGYVLVATVELADKTMPALFSGVLKDERAAAVQARELADAAAALIENVPEYADAFDRLHDVLDSLPRDGAPTTEEPAPRDALRVWRADEDRSLRGRDFSWFWQDADCEEPMGPFESERDAREDYRALRGGE